MQIKKTASGRKKLIISRSEWEKIGKLGGFMGVDDPDDYTGRHSYDTEVVIDGKPVPVRVGFDAHPASEAPQESMGQPLGEREPAGIDIVGVWGINPNDPHRLGDSVMDLIGGEQLRSIEREILESAR